MRGRLARVDRHLHALAAAQACDLQHADLLVRLQNVMLSAAAPEKVSLADGVGSASLARVVSIVISTASPIERLVMPGFGGFAGSLGNGPQLPRATVEW